MTVAKQEKSAGKEKGAPHSTVLSLGRYVDYQADAVVSKEIARTPGGTLTAFAFDAGQGLSEHSAPFDAFVQVLDGAAEIAIGGKPHRVAAGEAILMPKNVPHAVQAKERFMMLLTMLRG
jgi:quercetin dioxygenase-like cupin family protein